jgi:hypothetical protein
MLRADRDEISAGLRIIIGSQTQGAAAWTDHWALMLVGGRRNLLPQPRLLGAGLKPAPTCSRSGRNPTTQVATRALKDPLKPGPGTQEPCRSHLVESAYPSRAAIIDADGGARLLPGPERHLRGLRTQPLNSRATPGSR